MKKNVLLTGASGGFGKLIVGELINDGHNVIATMRDVAGKNKQNTEQLIDLGAKVFEMDVTDDRSVSKTVAQILDIHKKIDVLINNAGVGVLGLQECFTTDDWKKVFEVNVFGVQRVCREIIPQMRKNRDGLIINTSSLLGRMTVPFYGPYNASKWALEAMSENYRTELSQSGIEVCIVEPGGYPTSFIDHLLRPTDSSRAIEYGELGQMPEGFLKGFEQALASNPEQNPKKVAEAFSLIVSQKKGERAFRTVVDKMGMGVHIEPYNQSLAQLTSGVYGAFGIGHLLKLS